MRLMGMVVSMILVAGHAIAEECDIDQISTMIIDMKRWQNELERDDKLRSMDFMSGYYTSFSLAISSATAARTDKTRWRSMRMLAVSMIRPRRHCLFSKRAVASVCKQLGRRSWSG